jgi:hypothetical protein
MGATRPDPGGTRLPGLGQREFSPADSGESNPSLQPLWVAIYGDMCLRGCGRFGFAEPLSG